MGGLPKLVRRAGGPLVASALLRVALKHNYTVLPKPDGASVAPIDANCFRARDLPFDWLVSPVKYDRYKYPAVIRSPLHLTIMVRNPLMRVYMHWLHYLRRGRHATFDSWLTDRAPKLEARWRHRLFNAMCSGLGVSHTAQQAEQLVPVLRDLRDEFSLVMLYEKLDESMVLLARLLHVHAETDLVYLNGHKRLDGERRTSAGGAGEGASGDLAAAPATLPYLSTAARQVLEQFSQCDLKVYGVAAKRFRQIVNGRDSKFASSGGGSADRLDADKLAHFRAANAKLNAFCTTREFLPQCRLLHSDHEDYSKMFGMHRYPFQCSVPGQPANERASGDGAAHHGERSPPPPPPPPPVPAPPHMHVHHHLLEGEQQSSADDRPSRRRGSPPPPPPPPVLSIKTAYVNDFPDLPI